MFEAQVFDFVGDEALRASLTQDAAELASAMTHGANKAVVVLAGSIIEAVLLDHLISTDHQKRAGSDPTKYEFYKLIDVCNSEGVVSDRTVHLLHAVRDYRNLIHPGRSLRLNERVQAPAAVIAQSVVALVCAEMSDRPNTQFGMTAEQVIAKVKKDSHSVQMPDHLLADVKEAQLNKLLFKTIPGAIFDGDQDAGEDLHVIGRLFRACFQKADDNARRKVISQICDTIRNDSGARVRACLNFMFCGWYVGYGNEVEAKLIIDRLLVETRPNERTLSRTPYYHLLNGLPADVAKEFALKLSDRISAWSEDEQNEISGILLEFPYSGDYGLQSREDARTRYKEIVAALKEVIENYTSWGHPKKAAWLQNIVDSSDIPF